MSAKKLSVLASLRLKFYPLWFMSAYYNLQELPLGGLGDFYNHFLRM